MSEVAVWCALSFGVGAFVGGAIVLVLWVRHEMFVGRGERRDSW